MTRPRVLAAFVISPLVVPCVFGLISFAANFRSQPDHGVFTSGMTLLYLPVAYFAEFVLGLPVLAIFRRRRISSYGAFLAGGAVIGWIVARWFVGAWLTVVDLEFTFAAAASAGLFRLIAGVQHPSPQIAGSPAR